jgi:N-acetylmuramic acid 6-phosphate (MurNAc-6-P) etherase
MCHTRLPSITETPNELTSAIDLADPVGIVRLLRAVDAQIYNGYRAFPALCDTQVVHGIAQAIEWAAPLLGRNQDRVLISGAGTSGRLAMVAARTFNRHLVTNRRGANLRYLIAGGNLALIKAQEGAEDDPAQALTDLDTVLGDARRVLYIGVTCGLSAPYVASQIFELAKRRDTRCILIGFTPEDRARDVEVEQWDKTFADVIRSVRRKSNCLVLNPVVGPEAITGSTRMKGGSATKLLLEVILSLALRRPLARRTLALDIADALRAYEETRATVYEETLAIADLVALGGNALRRRRHIYYVGADPVGVLGIVDASECPPTFGADFDDVRGFLGGGWRTLLGRGHDLSEAGPWYRISLDDFHADIVPGLRRNDLVVAVSADRWSAPVVRALKAARRKRAAVAAVQLGSDARPPCPLDAHVRVGPFPRWYLETLPLFEEYAAKLVLNALTTGAHILAGKVYENRMIDLRISNNKLYHRTIGIIQAITGVSADRAKRCLLRSIYGVDRVPPKLLRARPSHHVDAATNAAKVVPRALIMAGGRATGAEAAAILEKEPIVRAAIDKLKKAKT